MQSETDSSADGPATQIASGIVRWAGEAMVAALPLVTHLAFSRTNLESGFKLRSSELTSDLLIFAMMIAGMAFIKQTNYSMTKSMSNYFMKSSLRFLNLTIMMASAMAYSLSAIESPKLDNVNDVAYAIALVAAASTLVNSVLDMR